MNSSLLLERLKELKEKARLLVLLVPKVGEAGGSEAVHLASVDLLLGIGSLEADVGNERIPYPSVRNKSVETRLFDEGEEVRKVNSRLNKWAANPNQINSAILACYLRLKKSRGGGIIREGEFRAAYGNDREFDRNYPQMKIIADRNHGKVFQVNGDIVEIWSKVTHAVGEFGRKLGI